MRTCDCWEFCSSFVCEHKSGCHSGGQSITANAPIVGGCIKIRWAPVLTRHGTRGRQEGLRLHLAAEEGQERCRRITVVLQSIPMKDGAKTTRDRHLVAELCSSGD